MGHSLLLWVFNGIGSFITIRASTFALVHLKCRTKTIYAVKSTMIRLSGSRRLLLPCLKKLRLISRRWLKELELLLIVVSWFNSLIIYISKLDSAKISLMLISVWLFHTGIIIGTHVLFMANGVNFTSSKNACSFINFTLIHSRLRKSLTWWHFWMPSWRTSRRI